MSYSTVWLFLIFGMHCIQFEWSVDLAKKNLIEVSSNKPLKNNYLVLFINKILLKEIISAPFWSGVLWVFLVKAMLKRPIVATVLKHILEKFYRYATAVLVLFRKKRENT